MHCFACIVAEPEVQYQFLNLAETFLSNLIFYYSLYTVCSIIIQNTYTVQVAIGEHAAVNPLTI
jgi:hypothetical protein